VSLPKKDEIVIQFLIILKLGKLLQTEIKLK